MKKSSLVIIILLLLLIGGGAGFLYFYTIVYQPVGTEKVDTSLDDAILKNYTNIRIFYPVGENMEIVEKKVSANLSRLELTELLLRTYFEISRDLDTGIVPDGTNINNIYISGDNIVYIDFSRTFKKNFRGDVIDEYMLLKTIYETIMGNVEDISDVVILIDGRERETLGGHFFLDRPLKSILQEGEL